MLTALLKMIAGLILLFVVVTVAVGLVLLFAAILGAVAEAVRKKRR